MFLATHVNEVELLPRSFLKRHLFTLPQLRGRERRYQAAMDAGKGSKLRDRLVGACIVQTEEGPEAMAGGASSANSLEYTQNCCHAPEATLFNLPRGTVLQECNAEESPLGVVRGQAFQYV